MNDARRRQADRIFAEALDLPSRGRAAFLDQACAGDEALRELVDRLLAHTETEGSFLQEGGALAGSLGDEIAGAAPRPEPVPEGTRLGAFRVTEEIGRGGMAVVYAGERDDGTFSQRVAIKVLKRGLDTDEIVRRFERERAILGRIERTDIARIYDGGSTPDGRPYIVMELVDGRPIDRYCREERLGVPERLRLFVRVARAVSAAHQGLVVHRDIKPSNVLITSDGAVKLLDFGIAKLLDESEPGATRTATGLALMTPAYASPEQVLGETITTATDVYQLGVLLYLLLTGEAPHAMDTASPVMIARRIVEDPPPRLPGKLGADLESIVMKTLAKRPAERYASVGQLVDDIERLLAGRPVMARPYTLMYRTRLFVRRNRLAVFVGTVLALLLVAFAVTATLQAQRVARERDRANREAEAAREAADYLASLFAEADPDRLRGGSLSALDLLETGRVRLGTRLADQPLVRARLATTLGGLYQKLGDYAAAAELHADAMEALESVDEPGSRERHLLIQSRLSLGTVLSDLGRLDESGALLDAALEEARAELGPGHEDTLGIMNNLGLLAMDRGELSRAEEFLFGAFEARREVLGERHEETLQSRMNIALLRRLQNRREEARDILREVLTARIETQGEDARTTIDTRYNLGQTLGELGDVDAWQEETERAHESYARTLGDANPRTLRALQSLARARAAAGKPAEALALAERGWAVALAAHPEDDPALSQFAEQLGYLLYELGEYEQAEARLRFVWDHRARRLGADHPVTLRAHFNVASLEALQGEREIALELLEGVLALGFREADPAREEDWRLLHDDPEFQRILAAAAP